MLYRQGAGDLQFQSRNKRRGRELCREICRKRSLRQSARNGYNERGQVLNDAKGAPFIELKGKAKEKADSLGVFSISVSLTHDGGMASAYCTMLADGKDNNPG